MAALTELTVNPIRARDPETDYIGHWCERTSPGCDNCFASEMQTRRFRMHAYDEQNRDKIEMIFVDSALDTVAKRKKPSKFLWCSMTDLFLESIPDDWIDKCFGMMYEAWQHTHIILTKRPERAVEYFKSGTVKSRIAKHAFHGHLQRNPASKGLVDYHEVLKSLATTWPMPNIWIGVSVENSDYLWRVDTLFDVPADKRFVCAEPLLGPVNLEHYLSVVRDPETKLWTSQGHPPAIDWVVSGGESGKTARLSQVEWFRLLRDQCAAAKVPFCHRRNGSYIQRCDVPEEVAYLMEDGPVSTIKGTEYFRVITQKGGNLLDGVVWDQAPEAYAP